MCSAKSLFFSNEQQTGQYVRRHNVVLVEETWQGLGYVGESSFVLVFVMFNATKKQFASSAPIFMITVQSLSVFKANNKSSVIKNKKINLLEKDMDELVSQVTCVLTDLVRILAVIEFEQLQTMKTPSSMIINTRDAQHSC